MPKSKRNKQISLTHTKKKNTLEFKKNLVEEIRSCVDTYAYLFVFSVNDMRNSKLKDVREQWKHSRFFFGKNKVMALALGRSSEEEYRSNLSKVSERLKGQRGLLFTNKDKEEVLKWFASFSDFDFARSGNLATHTVQLAEGSLPQFSHCLEPYLRQLGMPTSLQKGVVHLVKDFTVCKEGEMLTPEMARILKLLGEQMAEFHISVECCWSNNGNFEEFTQDLSLENEIKEMEIDNSEKQNQLSKNNQNGSDSCHENELVNNSGNKNSENDEAEKLQCPDHTDNHVKSDENGIPSKNSQNGSDSCHENELVNNSGNKNSENDEAEKLQCRDHTDNHVKSDENGISSKNSQNDSDSCHENELVNNSGNENDEAEKLQCSDHTDNHVESGENEVILSNDNENSPLDVDEKNTKIKTVQEIESSADERSPVFLALRSRTVKIKKDKKK